jgi:hypothetical protein
MKFTFIQKSIVATVGAVAMLGATAGAGHAFSIDEPDGGDFGELVPAPFVGSTTGADFLNGFINVGGDADLYVFNVGAESIFDAAVFGRGQTPLVDSQLFLFDGTGKALKANDDISTNRLSRISGITLNAGTYFLGISGFDYDPRNANGDYLFNNTFTGIGDPVVANPILASWNLRSALGGVNNSGAGGGYQIRINTQAVPSPALLPGLAALGFSAIRKRKAKAAVA